LQSRLFWPNILTSQLYKEDLLKWFRHFGNASESSVLSAILEKGGVEAYGRYWLFVELMVRHWDGEEPKITISLKTMSRQLGYYKDTMAKQWADNLQTIGLIVYNLSELNDRTMITIVFPKLKELQDKDSKYNRKKFAKRSHLASVDKELDKDKDKEVVEKEKLPPLETFEIPNNLIQTLKMNLGYPDDLIKNVASEAWMIYLASPPEGRNWNRFVAHYFKNESGKIRDRVIQMGKNYNAEEEAQKLRDKYAREEQ
jgi:hypothetical protein